MGTKILLWRYSILCSIPKSFCGGKKFLCCNTKILLWRYRILCCLPKSFCRSTTTCQSRGVYFSKNQYLFTNPKNGPARESRDTLSLDSDISARTQKKAIFLQMVVIFLHGPQKKCVFYAQLNKKVAKSTLYHIINCFACFSMI